MTRIAIIGAGLSGLTLARQLQTKADVSLFEKAPGPGGRMASRAHDGFSFDYGAQFFSVKTQAFERFLDPWVKAGVVKRWDARFAEFVGSEVLRYKQWDASFPHYVGAPDMNALPRALAADMDIHYNCHITQLTRHQQQWQLVANNQHIDDIFDWVILTLPAVQTAALLPADFSQTEPVVQTRMQACYALMMGFEQPLNTDWQAALVHDADISWMSLNSSKPDRDVGQTSMVVHARNQFADDNLQTDIDQIIKHMQQEVTRVAGLDVSQAKFVDCKRWHFANIPPQHRDKAFLDENLRLGVCGDWCIQGRVEAAFSSADDLSTQLNHLL